MIGSIHYRNLVVILFRECCVYPTRTYNKMHGERKHALPRASRLLRSTNLLLENTRKQIVMILLVFKTNLLFIFSELFDGR